MLITCDNSETLEALSAWHFRTFRVNVKLICLFACYVDEMLRKLNNSGLGCHINHLCYNAIMYADDILLMSISISDLQILVDICSKELILIDMIVNVCKSVCM